VPGESDSDALDVELPVFLIDVKSWDVMISELKMWPALQKNPQVTQY